MAGAPKGNSNAVRGFKATQALEKAIYRLSTGDESPCIDNMEILVKVWVKAIEKAQEDGDIQALNAIMDRLEGKPKQSLDIGGQQDNPIHFREIVLKGVHAGSSTDTDT